MPEESKHSWQAGLGSNLAQHLVLLWGGSADGTVLCGGWWQRFVSVPAGYLPRGAAGCGIGQCSSLQFERQNLAQVRESGLEQGAKGMPAPGEVSRLALGLFC